ncbi:MAG: SLATT domain-containing protein [Alphaproteobacteria bacterium]|nr:MAG: SLATT domain-containing protein [Alphaproteobacteria bacterium]
MNMASSALVVECQRQEESCRYTAASLHIWQKHARFWKVVFIIAPIILGGVAGSQILGVLGTESGKLVGLFCGLLAGFFPAIYASLDMGMQVKDIGRAAAEFTSLRDRFRQLASVTSRSSFTEFKSAFEQVMDRTDALRANSPTAPEWCFRRAQKKINRGDYTFTVDNNATP